MKRIENIFAIKKNLGGKVFIPYITAGLPNREAFFEAIAAFDSGGADIIEVGLPFSDPVADGPIIHAASTKALDMSISTNETLALVSNIAPKTRCPIVLMTYVNPILSYGYEQFAKEARLAGAASVIVPDLPPEESFEWREACAKVGLGTVFLVTPLTDDDRIRRISSLSDGFVYYVNLKGVTGSGIDDPVSVGKRIAHVKAISKKPVAAGFGISTPKLAMQLAKHADGVIVGSRFLEVILSAKPSEEIDNLKKEIRAFAKALDLNSQSFTTNPEGENNK